MTPKEPAMFPNDIKMDRKCLKQPYLKTLLTYHSFFFQVAKGTAGQSLRLSSVTASATFPAVSSTSSTNKILTIVQVAEQLNCV